MSNIVKAKVKIRGVRPLLQHRFGPDALPLEKQEKDGVAGNQPNEWRKSCMIDKNGQLYLEPTYFFSALRNGAKHTKKGARGSIQTDVSATLQVTDDVVLLNRFFPGYPDAGEFDVMTAEPPPNDKTLPVYMDIAGVRNPNTKSRNVRYRIACSPGWECEFNILWDKTIVARNQMEAVVNDTGVLIGLADGRGIGFGRFEVVSFETGE